MLNRSIIIGRFAADPEHRKTNSGKDNVTFTLCCERDGKNQEGNRDVDYIRCVAWNKTAENIAKYCTKGTLVAVEGRIQTRNYKNGDGFTVYVTEVLCNNVQFISSPKGNENAGNTNRNSSNAGYNGNGYDPVDIDDDDVPF